MFKIIGLLVSFLMEMVFGKKQTDPKVKAEFDKRRFVVSTIMVISFGMNYLAIGRLYSLSVSYIDLNNEKNNYKVKVETLTNIKSRADQLEDSLKFCMNASLAIQESKNKKSK
jgi:hypothetical protein